MKKPRSPFCPLLLVSALLLAGATIFFMAPAWAGTAYRDYLRGREAFERADYPEAFRIVREAMERGAPKGKDLTRALTVRAAVRKRLADFSGAMADLDRALELDGAFSPAMVGKGQLLLVTGRTSEALNWFDRAVRADPNSSRAHYNRGNAFFILGRLADAAGCYSAAMDLKKEAVYSRLMLFHVLRFMGDPDRAVRVLGNQGRRTEQWPTALRSYAAGGLDLPGLLNRMGDPGPLKAREMRCEAFHHAGLVHLAANDCTEAARLFQKALDENIVYFFDTVSSKKHQDGAKACSGAR